MENNQNKQEKLESVNIDKPIEKKRRICSVEIQ